MFARAITEQHEFARSDDDGFLQSDARHHLAIVEQRRMWLKVPIYSGVFSEIAHLHM